MGYNILGIMAICASNQTRTTS